MPINEILAPAYMIVKYNTVIYNHQLRFYFDGLWNLIDVDTAGEYYLAPTGGGVNTPVTELVDEIFTRATAILNNGTQVTEIQLWHSAAGVNNFVSFNTLPTPSGGDYGSGSGIAAASFVIVLSDSQRNQFRVSFFDTTDARPQRTAGVTQPDIDPGNLQWYMLKSGVPFTTNDGNRLSLNRSFNTGYNRKLARLYGRSVSP